LDIFEGIEPRLQASVTLPGSVIRDTEIEIRYGVMPKGINKYDVTKLLHTAYMGETYEVDGDTIAIQGLSGMGLDATTSTGFYNRKWFDPKLSEDYIKDSSHGGINPWIEFRYAEILLNIAEAAVELKTYGDASKMDEAAKIIHDIRERAGAKADKYNASTLTIDAVRSERRKEFYFENKTFWDLKRWRTAHEELVEKRWSIIEPIYFWTGNGDKHYYVRRNLFMRQDIRFTFPPRCYYTDIAGGNIKQNELLIPNPEQIIK
jgi:hypothetical protein